jgi:hypothetical protein
MAAANDIKAAKRVKDALCKTVYATQNATPEEFLTIYNQLLQELQHDLGQLAPTPIVSLASASISERRRVEEQQGRSHSVGVSERIRHSA